MTGWDEREYTVAAGTRMHAAVLGPSRAPELVFVHGLGCSHRYFLPLARDLGRELRVVAVDLPGFGRSPGPARALDVRGLSLALADWLRTSGRHRTPLLANSNGCQVVVDLATHSPELLGPVVLVSPTVDRHARTMPRQAVRLLRDIAAEHPALLTVVVVDYLRCGLRRLLASTRYMLDDPVERKLRYVTTPALVIRGQRDPIVPREWAREVARLLPAGRYAEVPGAGHALNYSAPAPLASLTRRHLEVTAEG